MVDGGASGNYITVRAGDFFKNKIRCNATNQITVQVANGQSITSTHTTKLVVPGGDTLQAYIFPEINGSLISVSTFVDIGYTVTYDKEKVTFRKNKAIVFEGYRDSSSGLWMIDLNIFKTQSSLAASPAVRLQNREQFVRYWHACFGFPSKTTFLKALNTFLLVPGLSASDVKKYLPNIVNTALGHLDATRKNIMSTKIKLANEKDVSPPAVWMTSHELTGRVHSDATGALPIVGYNKAKYLIIFFNEDNGYIHLETSTSRQGPELLKTLQSALTYFKNVHADTHVLRLDNECSNSMQKHVHLVNIKLELTPASQHRTNKAERAIRTAKNHIISTHAGVDKDCPAYLWPHYNQQIECTLNLLRLAPSGTSAWEALHGPYDFNACPIAPLGTKVVAHVPPQERATWAQHGLIGYYVGPAPQHYRCFQIWIEATKAIRISDCVEWFPVDILNADIDAKLAALPLISLHSADFQRVEKSSQPTPPIPTVSSPIAEKQRVPAPTEIQITVDDQQQLEHTPRQRLNDRYFNLSPAETRHLSKPTYKKIGQSFSDTNDPSDTASGIIIAVVKHKKSRKLCYKYYDEKIFSDIPTSPKDFHYINVRYALQKCKFHKVKSMLQAFAAAVSMDDTFRNHGTTSMSRRKQRRQRQRPRLEWYQTRSTLRASSAQETFASTNSTTEAFLAMSAVDLNADGSLLTFNSAMKGPDRLEWMNKYGEELVRLEVSGTGVFISRSAIPKGKKIAYSNPQVKIKMKNGVLVKRVRVTIGGDKLTYIGLTAAQTAALEVIRVQLNSAVSEGAHIMCIDIENYYLGTPLEEHEYMSIPMKHIPLEVRQRYNLDQLATDGFVYMRIEKTIYGLKQAGILSQNRLVEHLAKHEYIQCQYTPCLFIHNTNGTAFTLVVDDFLIKYKDQATGDHLIKVLEELYVITVDKALKQKYVGITIDYHKDKGYIDVSMPGYVQKALVRFQKNGIKGVNSPMVYTPPRYGLTTQTINADGPPSEPLNAAQILRIQEVVGVFLYYARAVDPMMLTAINKIGSRQATADTSILTDIDRFLQYASRWDSAKMRIHASDMQLQVHSDASYLSESKSRSRAGAFMFLGKLKPGAQPNAPLLYLSVIISTVVDSATAAEYAALFIAAQAATSLRMTLAELGYPQAATPIICDNQCAVGIANNSFTQKRSKTIDMRYHWIRDQVNLGNYTVSWEPGATNLADFFTKAHPVEHHVVMQQVYLVHEEGVLESQSIPTN